MNLMRYYFPPKIKKILNANLYFILFFLLFTLKWWALFGVKERMKFIIRCIYQQQHSAEERKIGQKFNKEKKTQFSKVTSLLSLSACWQKLMKAALPPPCLLTFNSKLINSSIKNCILYQFGNLLNFYINILSL